MFSLYYYFFEFIYDYDIYIIWSWLVLLNYQILLLLFATWFYYELFCVESIMLCITFGEP